MPALRNRNQDIIPLAEFFIEQHSQKYLLPAPKLSQTAITALTSYTWPGNVRELSHMMARAVLMNETATIEVNELAFKQLKSTNVESASTTNKQSE